MWSIFFFLAGLSNIIQAYFFHFSNDPSTSAATLLGMNPSGSMAMLKIFEEHTPSPMRDKYPQIDQVFAYTNELLTPEFQFSGEKIIWKFVTLAGFLYCLHGVRKCKYLSSTGVLFFAFLKFNTAATLLFVDYFGKPGPYTRGIGVSEIFWGVAFYYWGFVVSKRGFGKRRKAKVN